MAALPFGRTHFALAVDSPGRYDAGTLISSEPEFPQEALRPWLPKLLGAALILISLALTASLVTYELREMGWAFLNPHDAAEAAARPCTNLLGVPGLYLAGLLYAAFGAGAYYLLFLLIIEGIVSLFSDGSRGRIGPALALLALFACALAVLDIQPWLLQQWSAGLALKGAGGALGYLYGSCVLEALMGRTWSLVLLIAAHGGALIYFGRTTPRCVWQELWHLCCAACAGIAAWFARRREAKRQRAEAAAAEWKQQQAEAPREQQQAEAPREQQVQQQTDLEEEEEDLPRELQQPEPPRRIILPPRRRSSVQPTSRPEPVPMPELPEEPEEDYMPPRPFEEHDARQREDDERRVNLQQAPNSRSRITPAPLRPRGSNLLDLMHEVEEQIELDTYSGGSRYDAPAPPRSGMSLNPGLEAAVNRRTGYEAPQPASPEPRRAKTSVRPAPAVPAPRPLPEADPRKQEADYPLPPYNLLSYEPMSAEHSEEAKAEMMEMQQRIMESLGQFKIPVTAGDITRGPSITRYEFYPPNGLRVNRITNLSNELMLATCSKSINILAPVPGKDTVGIELANSVKTPVYLRELLQDAAFRSPKLRIPVALGKDVYGNTVIGDLAAMPHTLVAGTTGSGKSVCINSMIISMLYKFRPDELKLILVDPKVVEMQPYKRLPHLACPVVTNPGRVISALRWAVNEMEHRYKLFSKIGVRNFEDYNAHACEYIPEEEPLEAEGAPDPEWVERFAADIERQAEEEVPLSEVDEQGEFDFEDDNNIPLHLPYIVIIIDELADLMMMVKEDLENYIARLTQKARAAGIHLVVATQTPRSNVVTGIIKANIPSRIAFKVASPLDSRIILDTAGAENLLGQGDCLFLPPGGITRMSRAQGAFVSDDEVAAVVKHCARHAKQNFDQGVLSEMESGENGPNADNGGRITGKGGNDEDDELYTRCVNLVVTERKASTSLLQRRFSIGYGRAAKIMDMMEERGVISSPQGATRAREVLVDAP